MKLLRILLLLLAASLTGCSVTEGLRGGLTTGLSDALSALIVAPVTYALDQAFNPPP